jgi:hypothetical protein
VRLEAHRASAFTDEKKERAVTHEQAPDPFLTRSAVSAASHSTPSVRATRRAEVVDTTTGKHTNRPRGAVFLRAR